MFFLGIGRESDAQALEHVFEMVDTINWTDKTVWSDQDSSNFVFGCNNETTFRCNGRK